MYPLGHLGIALTATRLIGYLGYRARVATNRRPNKPPPENISDRAKKWISGALDARFLLLGDVLPDLIDKPLGLLILKPPVAAGHVFSHTLLFALILFSIATLFHNRRRKAMFALALGVTFHLALDYLWRDPQVLFWPLFGWQFARGTSETFAQVARDAVKWFVVSPDVIVGEIIGGISLLVTFGRLKKEGWRKFFLRGEL